MIIWAGVLAVIAVSMGALGAHAIKPLLTSSSVESYLTGARYNMYHAIALLALSASSKHLSKKWVNITAYCFVIGTLLFSGSIYLLSTSAITGLTCQSFLGPITPIGGLILITGWIFVTIGAIKHTK